VAKSSLFKAISPAPASTGTNTDSGSGAGALPFESDGDDLDDTSDEDDFYPQLDRTFVSVREHRRLPRLLAECIDKCLQQEPGLRPSLEQLFDALTRVAALDPKTIGAVYESAATVTNR
jgi:hypothetical protein